ncbi:hotdog fold thioesterase [Ornithinimicrobium panacihumi]|uniref:hotdog fold thioesterase n=1 Tax=Ornithinimicrobium panacihumi TaxID=2008449 RepID=UPI003F8B8452
MTDKDPARTPAAAPHTPEDFPFTVSGTLVERMGMELLEVGAQRTSARMPVEGNTQPYGLLHGGASAALAETVGSIAAALHAGPDRISVGVDLNATHHRAVREGWVTGVATPLSLGRSVASYEIVVTDDQDRRVCTARLTCALRDKPPGA